MKLTLQKEIDPNTLEIIWLMLDADYQVIEPIQVYSIQIGIRSTEKPPL